MASRTADRVITASAPGPRAVVAYRGGFAAVPLALYMHGDALGPAAYIGPADHALGLLAALRLSAASTMPALAMPVSAITPPSAADRGRH